jgi:hypothetical protein
VKIDVRAGSGAFLESCKPRSADYVASASIEALKPAGKSCCGPSCCAPKESLA